MTQQEIHQEVDRLMTTGDSAFAQIVGTDRAAMEAYSDVQEKHAAIMRLEKSIEELAQV